MDVRDSGRQSCNLPLAVEAQGEAFGFLVSRPGYVTLSEGSSPTLSVALLR